MTVETRTPETINFKKLWGPSAGFLPCGCPDYVGVAWVTSNPNGATGGVP